MTGRDVIRIPRASGRAGLGRWWRRLIVLAVCAGGLVVFLPATDDSLDANVANEHFALGVAVWAFAAMIPVWAGPEPGMPQLPRLRRLHRRTAWRLGFLGLFAASLALVGNTYWQVRAERTSYVHHPGRITAFEGNAHDCAVLGLWLLCLCPLPVLVETPSWRLWPAPIRRGLRCARAAERLTGPFRSGPAADFDPDQGAAGRPAARSPRFTGGPPSDRPCAASLSGGGRRDGARSVVELRWDGSRLTLRRGVGEPVEIRVAGRETPPGGGRPAGTGGTRRPVAELVWYSEPHKAVRSPGGRWVTRETALTLLDAEGFRVGTVHGARREWSGVLAVARAAGLPFAAYDLGAVARSEPPRANALLFPRRGRQLRMFAN